VGGLVFDSSGNLYGTTSLGGVYNDGIVFELAKGSSVITSRASFDRTNGEDPVAGLLKDSSGNLYGTTALGGAYNGGTVFELAKSSSVITTLASFYGIKGSRPSGGLIVDSGGDLYGTTEYGGVSNRGTVFELVKGSSVVTTLASFGGANGEYPVAGLLIDGSGNLYGTTSAGGANGDGTVFEVAAGSGLVTTLASLGGSNGSDPIGGLTLDGSGDLLGTTESGGANADGSVFELSGVITAQPPPTVVNPASATPSPVTGTTTNLSALGNDAAGEASLDYTWAVTSAPTGAPTPTFSSNGSNASQDTTATFYRAGTYTFQVTLTDPSNRTAVSSVTVTVNQTLAAISVSPGSVTLAVHGQQQFQAVTLDQFGQSMATQPSSYTWSIASGGIGSISSSGLYTAPNSGIGSATVQATSSGITGTATVTIKPQPPVITQQASANPNPVIGTQTQLQVQASDPQGAKLSYSWAVTSPAGAPAPTFNNASSNKTAVTFHQAGSYTFTVTVQDALGASTTSSVTVSVVQTLASLSIAPGNVTLAEGGMQQFTALALDQFGNALLMPLTFTWQVNGNGGTVSTSGLYTAPKRTGNFQVTVSAGGKNAQAKVTVDP